MHYIKRIIATLLLASFLQAEDFVQIKSHYSVDETAQRISDILKTKKLNIFATVDHHANAKSVGLSMNEAKVIIFGNPKVGTKVMREDIKAALDLPLRMLVYAHNTGEVYIRYGAPQSMSKAYNISNTKVLNGMSNALDKIAAKAAN